MTGSHGSVRNSSAKLWMRSAPARVREVPQPPAGVTYAEKISKAEALIDWQQDAVQIWRRVRAFNPWPIAETRLNGAQLRIWDAQLASSPTSGDALPTGTPDRAIEQAPARRREPCSPPRTRASTSPAAGVFCAFSGCSSPAANRWFAREFIKGQRLDGARFAPA